MVSRATVSRCFAQSYFNNSEIQGTKVDSRHACIQFDIVGESRILEKQ